MPFNFSIYSIVSSIVPSAIKMPKLLALINCFNKPIESLYNAFVSYRILSIQEKNKTGQVIVLQRALSQYAELNGGFFESSGMPVLIIPDNANIHVEDYENTVVLPASVLINEKLVPNDFIQVSLISEGIELQCATIEESEPAFDFQIRIHESLILDVTQKTLRSVVDAYKNLGRTYTVIIYN